MELRQQVAVGQSKRLPIQEGAGRGSDFIGAILVNLVRKWGAEIVIQLLQSLQQAFLQIFIGLRVGVLDICREFGENIHARCVGLRVMSSQTGILWGAEVFLQELLDLVGVGFHLAAVQQEGRLGTRSQVLQDVRLPLHIHGGDIKRDSFQPQHHEETLGERTVSDALTIAPRLHEKFNFGLIRVAHLHLRMHETLGLWSRTSEL